MAGTYPVQWITLHNTAFFQGDVVQYMFMYTIHAFLPQRDAGAHFVATGKQQDHEREQRGNGACAPIEIIRVPVSVNSLSQYDSCDELLSMLLM